MKADKVEEIVSLVLEEIKNRTSTPEQAAVEKTSDEPAISLFGDKPSNRVQAARSKEAPKEMVSLHKQSKGGQAVSVTPKLDSKKREASPETERDKADRLIEKPGAYSQYTPARIAVGRAGPRPRTSTMLKFRYDHAAAVDAVYGHVDQEILDKLDLFTVYTKVEEKEVYIRRPDLGRRFTDESKKILQEKCQHAPTVQIIASNGLSASAINENLEDVYLSLKQSLDNLNITVGTSFYVHEGRVGVMDDVGEVLSPDVVINLIGERPGLVSAESLSAYLCYQPKIGTIESDRMVISNIHKGGIPPIEAGAYLGTVVERILKHQASGVKLIQKEG